MSFARGAARRLQILNDGFDSRQEQFALDIYAGGLLTRRVQAHIAVYHIIGKFSVQRFKNIYRTVDRPIC